MYCLFSNRCLFTLLKAFKVLPVNNYTCVSIFQEITVKKTHLSRLSK